MNLWTRHIERNREQYDRVVWRLAATGFTFDQVVDRLRERTGSFQMDCRMALLQADGDPWRADTLLFEKQKSRMDGPRRNRPHEIYKPRY